MSIIEILKVIVLGIVEGFTEWLPISSTGHMILVDELIQLDCSDEFLAVFLVVIQFGAMLAVIAQFFRKLNPFDPRKKPEQKAETWRLWLKIIIACIPAAVLGFFLDDWIEAKLFNGLVVAVMLIVYGILFIVVENINQYKVPTTVRMKDLSYQTAFYIGLFQVLALIPGTSRSGSTILGAMILGCSRSISAEFSFFLGIPVIFGASVLKLAKYGLNFTGTEVFYLILGMTVAFIVSLYSIKFFVSWIKKNNFKLFGYYRIILGVIVLMWYMISNLIGK